MASQEQKYVVGPNDTLESIAARQLGSASAWTDVATRNRLGPHDRLLVGQHLSLPPSAARQRAELWRQAIALDTHNRHSPERRPATTIPGLAYHFVIADEMNPLTRRAVRKVLLPPKGVTDLTELARLSFPEHHGFSPRDTASNVSIGRHVGGRVDSRFTSASTRPLGSPRFPGQRFWINLDKAKAAGVTVHDGAAIAADLDRVIAKTRNPQ